MISIADFLVWLVNSGGVPMQGLASQLVRWLCFHLDQGGCWATGDTDAITSAPMPRGTKRHRRYDPMLVNAVAKLAGEGDMARSGAKAMALLQRFRFKKRMGFAIRSANLFPERRAAL